MQVKDDIKFLMEMLTFTNIVVFAVFILFLSSSRQMESRQVGAYQVIEPIYAASSLTGGTSSENSNDSEIGTAAEIIRQTEVEIENNYETDDNILDKFKERISGYYTVSGVYFHFYKEGGKFDGFFDNSQSNLIGGFYEVKMKDGEPVVYIYDATKSYCVYYYLSLNNSNNVVLTHRTSNTVFELKL
jgi:hypothetical protein